MCSGPYREVTEIDGEFVKEEAKDLKREGFYWCEQEAGRIPGMEREHEINLETE